MKRQYEKPMLSVEHYALTQTIASCTTVKINSADTQCVLDDPDSTNAMLNLTRLNAFLSSGACRRAVDGQIDSNNSLCYHTNISSIFTST